MIASASTIYASASNYDAAATVNDGSCSFDKDGCTYAPALNYDRHATDDDGSCDFGAGRV